MLSCCLEMPPPKAELNTIRLGFLFYLFILYSLTAATVDLTRLQLGDRHKVQRFFFPAERENLMLLPHGLIQANPDFLEGRGVQQGERDER